ncbi:replication initiation protein [Paracoccus marcusii]|uniref:replication initiation protein n=1 Tax=Paracoccus marcusii TaxID=59779 RepID=UPI0032637BBA
MGKTIQVASDREADQGKTVLPTEFARGVYIENAPGAQALKLMHLLIAIAGGRMADDIQHELRMADLKAIEGMRNHDRSSLRALFIELRGAVIAYDNTEEQAEIIGGFLDEVRIDYQHEASGHLLVKWWFGRTFRRIAAESNHWAILDRPTIFAMTSKYSILLFQHIASLANLDHINSKTFTIPELRSLLGVPSGKLDRFSNMTQKAIQPAIAEINHLSRLTLTATPNKIGRTVASVTIGWQVKEDPRAAKRELEASKIGRKARREGTTETIVASELPPFPQAGGFTYSPAWKERFEVIWADLGKPHGQRPDSSLVAKQVRGIAVDQKISFDSPQMAAILANVLNKWGQT